MSARIHKESKTGTTQAGLASLRAVAPLLISLFLAACGLDEEPSQPRSRPAGAETRPEALSALTAVATGLNFPSNGQTSTDIKFRFTGSNLFPAYPATYVWRVNLRKQAGYYTTFVWGPTSQFTGANYYGCQPYPDGEPKTSSTSHKWDFGGDGKNFVTDANGHSTQLGYDVWRTQALRAYDNGANKVHEFYWDLPDTTKVIRVLLARSYGTLSSSSATLTFGGDPWASGQERLSGILRGIQLYATKLSPVDILAEINSPLSTSAGTAGVWYLNVNPTPSDIADKSGKGHNPVWSGSGRPSLWTDTSGSPTPPTVSISANPGSVASGETSTLSWSSTNATSCAASGAWSGSQATSGSQQTAALASTSTFTLTCTGAGGSANQSATVTVTNSPPPPPPAPTVSLSANPGSVSSGGTSMLSWSSTNATSCAASGAWSGSQATSGSQQTAALTSTSTFTLTCTGAGGSANQSATVTVTNPPPPPPPAPTVTLSASPGSVASGGTSTLSWSSTNATSCAASDGWSGSKATGGSEQTGPLSGTTTFALTCTGAGGSASQSATVSVATASGPLSGLVFPSNGQTSNDVKFRFTGSNLLPIYPATYIWRANLRRQAGYYTTFFWAPNGEFTGANFYGCHPYPDGEPKPTSTSHKWELSIDGKDFVNDANGHSTQLGYDIWRIQAFRAYDNGVNKVHEFYWDLPDTTKVIRVLLDRSYGSIGTANASLTWGDAPWSVGEERMSGILRGIQIYNARLTTGDILSEVNNPLGTSAGGAAVWYLNINPTPADISDKSGRGHNPTWASPSRPALWTGP